MIHLERAVEVLAFDAHATVAVGRHRPEFLAVARLAADLDRPIDGPTVARELLGGLTVAGWRVVDRAVSLGLLVREGAQGPARLSEAGAKALEAGVVLVPEERLWRFYTAADPLVEEALLHVAPVPSANAKDERDAIRGAKNGGPSVERRGDAPTGLLRSVAVKGRVWISLATGESFEVHELAASGARAAPSRLTLALDCAPVEAPTVALRGALNAPEGAPRPIDRHLGTPAACRSLRHEDLWCALVAMGSGVTSAELQAWRERAGALVLPVTFDDRLPEPARRGFRSTVSVPRPEIARLGSFSPTRLDEVPLIPRSDRDASAWAEWSQWSALDRYATPTLIEESRLKVRGMFPCHRPALASDEQLLQRARGALGDPRARFLLTPYDLGLWS